MRILDLLGDSGPARDAGLYLQTHVMFWNPTTYTYREEFTHYGMNIYPRIEGYANTGHVVCMQDAVRRAVNQIARLRSQTEVGSKPIAIQEAGVSGYIGGFTTKDTDDNPPFAGNKPFYLQEVGRYLGYMVPPLSGLNVERVAVFALYHTVDTPFAGEGGYSLMAPQNAGLEIQRFRASLLWFGAAMKKYYDPTDPPGTGDWVIVTDEVVAWPFA